MKCYSHHDTHQGYPCPNQCQKDLRSSLTNQIHVTQPFLTPKLVHPETEKRNIKYYLNTITNQVIFDFYSFGNELFTYLASLFVEVFEFLILNKLAAA